MKPKPTPHLPSHPKPERALRSLAAQDLERVQGGGWRFTQVPPPDVLPGTGSFAG